MLKTTVAAWGSPWIGTHSSCQFTFVHIMQKGRLARPASHRGITHRLPRHPWTQDGGHWLPISYSRCTLWSAPLYVHIYLCSDLCRWEVWKFPVSVLMSMNPKDVTWACSLPRAVPADTRESLVHAGSPRAMSGFSKYPFFSDLANRNDTTISYAMMWFRASFLLEGRKTRIKPPFLWKVMHLLTKRANPLARYCPLPIHLFRLSSKANLAVVFLLPWFMVLRLSVLGSSCSGLLKVMLKTEMWCSFAKRMDFWKYWMLVGSSPPVNTFLKSSYFWISEDLVTLDH